MEKHNFIFLLPIFFSFANIAQQTDTIKVRVHDHQMTLYVSGNGKPAVILEAGGGSNHKTWELVQPKLANSTKVVSYDRPGYLNSDTCTSPRDAITIARELREALIKANIHPPYILSGWSYGGSLVRVFAGLYPNDVVGMALVDPAPEEVYARLEKEFPEIMKEDEKYMQEILNSKSKIGEREEMRMYDSSMNQGRRSDKLHSTPTTLLIAAGKAEGGQDRDPSNPMNKAWIEELEKWAKKRPNLNYRIITNSGHHVARFQPDTVVNAINYHVDQFHSKTHRWKVWHKVTKIPEGDSLGNLRKEESRCACKIMGIEAPIFLGIERLDTKIGVGNYFREHKRLLDTLKVLIPVIQPDVILTFGPDGDTHHSEHIVTGAAVTELLLQEEWVDKYPLYYLAWTKELGEMGDLGYVHEEYFNVKIDYSNEDELIGLEAMKCNVTQFTAEEMKEDYDKKVKDPNNFVHFRKFVAQKGLKNDFFQSKN